MNDVMNACDEIMNVCNTTTYAKTVNISDRGAKLISITREEKTVYYLYWDNDSHTKENTVNYLNGITTNIRKEIPSITSMG